MIIYLMLVCLYFCRKEIGLTGQLMLDITKTLPVLFLSIATLFASDRGLISLALLLSAAGDLAGEEGIFLLQIALFALAHIAYIADFSKCVTFNRRNKITIAVWALFVVLFGGWIVSHISSATIMAACSVYMLIIGSMTALSFAIKAEYKPLYIIAALLFLFSDSCIAWNKFVEHFSGAGVTIMTTYFAAQGLFAWLAIGKRA